MQIPDLTDLRSSFEEALVDECVITHDPESTGDDIFDPVTGDLTPGAGEPSAAIYAGPCLVTEDDESNRVVTQGSEEEYRRRYRVSLPASAPAIAIGAVVTVTVSAGDPQLVGQPMPVRQVTYGSIRIRRRITCELILKGPKA